MIGSRNDHDRDPENGTEEDMSMLVDEDEDDDVPDVSRSEKIGLHEFGDDHSQEKDGRGLNEPGASWAIVAVVKKKIIFSKRPMPITNKK
jgi:hypothetical protein